MKLLNIALLGTACTVNQFLLARFWNLPPARTERQVILHSYLVIGCSSQSDSPVWSINGAPQRSFSLKAVWNEIRSTNPEVSLGIFTLT